MDQNNVNIIIYKGKIHVCLPLVLPIFEKLNKYLGYTPEKNGNNYNEEEITCYKCFLLLLFVDPKIKSFKSSKTIPNVWFIHAYH